MKKVTIFGSSGSIGRNALDIIRKNKNDFYVQGLCVYKNTRILKKQIEEFKPKYICIVKEEVADKIGAALPSGTKLFKGETGLEEFSSLPSDISLIGISGIACLKPLLINMKRTKRIALANKESLVVGAELVKEQARRYNSEVIPVDSEINALFQLLSFASKEYLKKVYLTASGGSLFNCSEKHLRKITLKDVLQHPTWQMGRRITVDSATLINKGFEVIETRHFFSLDYKMIDVVIHRESKVHALVELKDGITFSCLYNADMRIPIGHAFYHPERKPFLKKNCLPILQKLNFSFHPVDLKRFPLLKIVLEAARREDNSLVVINACDEVAIDYFLKKRVSFLSIYKAIEYIFSKYERAKLSTLEEILFWDNWARVKTKEYLEKECC